MAHVTDTANYHRHFLLLSFLQVELVSHKIAKMVGIHVSGLS